MNKAIIIGNLGQAPDIKAGKSGVSFGTLSVATNERKNKEGEYEDHTEWHRVVAWGKLAEVCQKYVKKGSQIYVEGPIQTRQWEDKEGQKRYTTEIKVLTLQLLDSRPDGGEPRGERSASVGKGAPTAPVIDDSVDDDLPF
jgi:single-strand DNA-binding protein